ncbi:MAG: AmpG family muropeptide MFS transporter [Alphaproteobacteria bacterium]|jgi:PAT family beta-lactamase induction signal transducer AmpG
MGRWLDAAAVYRDPRMALIGVLGFSSGLPLALSFGTLSAWLASTGIDRTTIGLFALMGLPYALKFLWSPLIDGLKIPILTRRLGRRRSWMVTSQLLLFPTIIALGLTNPVTDIGHTALLALMVAFLSATQDIVIDAYRVEILAAREQGAGAAAVQLGYRVGMLVSGAGALYIADAFGWSAAYGVMALGMGVGLLAILMSSEPKQSAAYLKKESSQTNLNRWMADHVVAPFADFLKRPGWMAVLLFIVLYKFGDAVAGVMANTFFVSIGFSLSAIASVTKVFGIGATLIGAVAGGVVVLRYGLFPALLWCGGLQMLSNLMFAVQASVGADMGLLALTVGIENISGGMGTAAFVAYLSRLCHFDFTATQYALFSSLAAVGRTVLSSGGGWLAERLDWVWFFITSAVCAVPGLLILLWIMRRPEVFDSAGD